MGSFLSTIDLNLPLLIGLFSPRANHPILTSPLNVYRSIVTVHLSLLVRRSKVKFHLSLLASRSKVKFHLATPRGLVQVKFHLATHRPVKGEVVAKNVLTVGLAQGLSPDALPLLTGRSKV